MLVKLFFACKKGALIGLQGSKSNSPNFSTKLGGVNHSTVVLSERSKDVSISFILIVQRNRLKKYYTTHNKCDFVFSK